MLKDYNSFIDKIDFNSLLEQTIINPNFSIVVPGGCNAKCEFCFYKQSKVCENYINKLVETLNDMPTQFYQLSLTGGEPTLSPYLESILNSIDTDRFTHTVLTTNGTKLEKFIPILKEKIKFINISRHHYNDEINESIFKTDSVPNTSKLKDLVIKLKNEGLIVTFSAVITEHLDSKEDIEKYIQFAKDNGVDNIFFRKQHGTLNPSNAEKSFEHITSETHTCPVCRNTKQVINESHITWKSSLEEPSKELGMIYEVIYNENGTLTTDWENKFVVEPLLIKENINDYQSDNAIFECGGSNSSSDYGSSYGSCGSDSSSGCGGYVESDEDDDQIKLEERRLKIEKLKRLVAKRTKKQQERYKDNIQENLLFKYNTFIKNK